MATPEAIGPGQENSAESTHREGGGKVSESGLLKSSKFDRREFLRTVAGLGIVAVAPAWLGAFPPDTLPNPVGYATISWPDREFMQALAAISGLGFKGVQILGWVRQAYSGKKQAALRERLEALKLKPVVFSCWDVELNPNKPQDESRQLRGDAEYLHQLAGLYLQVTDGGNPHKQYSDDTLAALGARMNTLGKVAEEYGLALGYHPHFGTIGETREGLGRMLAATDPRYVKLIADVGHLTLGGADPAEVIRTYQERLIVTHFKDVRKDVAALARQSRDLVRKRKYHFCEVGQGDVNFPAIVQAFRDVHYRGWVIFELDSYQERPGGPAESARMDKQAAEKLGFSV
jgi:inosose dehydratase